MRDAQNYYIKRNKLNLRRGYELKTNLVKDKDSDQLADSHNMLNRRKHYFSQLLNVHNVSDVRQIEVHTATPLVPSLSCLEAETAFAK
jgi:hypothetical protein